MDKLRHAAGLAMALALAGCACGDRLQLLGPPRNGAAGVPIAATIRPNPALLPAGATASFPSFDGDAFSAVLTVHPQQELPPAQALQEIEPVLRAMGFERSLAELRVPDEPVRLPAAELGRLAEEVCREAALQQDGTAREVCAALRGGRSAVAEAASRRAYGVGLAQLQADVERPVLQYPFAQLVGGVPIDGAGVFAARHSGESLATVHGTLFNDYVVVNRASNEVKILQDAALRMLGNRLQEPGPVEPVWSEPMLVMLASGSRRTARGNEVPALRHAWRVLLESRDGRSWLVWIDAETAEVLQVSPQSDHAQLAQGERWRRDPGLPDPTEVATFEVNPASGGRFVLALSAVFKRVDLFGDGIVDDEDEVAVPASSGGSFDLLIHDEESALCRAGHDAAYRQVHAYSHLYSLWKIITSAGSIPAFPEKPIQVEVDTPDDGDGSRAVYDSSTLSFVDGDGFRDAKCPDKKGERLNGVQDSTTLAHEMAHLSIKRLQERRPKSWCGSFSCQLPNVCGRAFFHDFADAVALAYASTPCFSGWTHKNMDGTDEDLYCRRASERGGLPRRIEVQVDRFPDHRALGTGPYADGQIAAAALWTVREGMRSKDPASGTALFWTRLQRALWDYSFLQPTCSGMSCTACDRDLYRYLQDLERKLVVQWAAPGIVPVPDAHTVNKVLAGWAAAGIFLVPFQCLDGDAATLDPDACPAGEGGGDAVIDVDDGDPSDDLSADGVRHPEVDSLRRGGPTPRFRIWTGPHFLFKAPGNASIAGAPPCNSQYRVEVSADPGFASAAIVEGVAAGCHAEVDFPGWSTLPADDTLEQVFYYRVTTWDAAGGNERISTSPGAGAFTVPPPFVVVNETGKP
jgi:hypothetical protein